MFLPRKDSKKFQKLRCNFLNDKKRIIIFNFLIYYFPIDLMKVSLGNGTHSGPHLWHLKQRPVMATFGLQSGGVVF
jgi:hypothetical protein